MADQKFTPGPWLFTKASGGPKCLVHAGNVRNHICLTEAMYEVMARWCSHFEEEDGLSEEMVSAFYSQFKALLRDIEETG